MDTGIVFMSGSVYFESCRNGGIPDSYCLFQCGEFCHTQVSAAVGDESECFKLAFDFDWAHRKVTG